MTNLNSNEKGFSHGVLVLLVVLVGVIGFAGYTVMQGNQKAGAPAASVTPAKASTSVPEKITSKQDVEQADKALDSDNADKALDSAQLDSDLNSML